MAALMMTQSYSTMNHPRVLFPPKHTFSGRPSANTMHEHIIDKIRLKKYFSITKMPLPYAPWSPLPTNANMETRPCHCSSSRIHTLTCGHTIAVPRDAEKCAPNCVGMDNALSADERKARKESMDNVHRNAATGYNEWILAQTTEKNNFPMAWKFYHAQKKMNFVDQVPRPDLVSGDFSCQMCGSNGHRDTVPAFVLNYHPYWCVVVAKDQWDAAIVKELFEGVVPESNMPAPETRDKNAAAVKEDAKKKIEFVCNTSYANMRGLNQQMDPMFWQPCGSGQRNFNVIKGGNKSNGNGGISQQVHPMFWQPCGSGQRNFNVIKGGNKSNGNGGISQQVHPMFWQTCGSGQRNFNVIKGGNKSNGDGGISQQVHPMFWQPYGGAQVNFNVINGSIKSIGNGGIWKKENTRELNETGGTIRMERHHITYGDASTSNGGLKRRGIEGTWEERNTKARMEEEKEEQAKRKVKMLEDTDLIEM